MPVSDAELEHFIRDWHWDARSHQYARQSGRLLLDFVASLKDAGLSEKTIRKHRDNCWSIGILDIRYGYHDTFSPAHFSGGPRFLLEFKRKVSDTNYAINSYKTTWRKLARYVVANEIKTKESAANE